VAYSAGLFAAVKLDLERVCLNTPVKILNSKIIIYSVIDILFILNCVEEYDAKVASPLTTPATGWSSLIPKALLQYLLNQLRVLNGWKVFKQLNFHENEHRHQKHCFEYRNVKKYQQL
jgi:hypothetical protein